MSYLNKAEQLFNQKRKWDYYSCHYQRTLRDVFEYPVDFIGETFISGHKHKLTDQNAQAPNISDARAAHSISAYFMGFILAEGLLRNMNNFCEIEDNEFPFSYAWYLTSLYHDYGYCFERDTELANRICEQIAENEKTHVNDYYSGVLYRLRKDQKISIQHSPWSVNRPYSIFSRPRYSNNNTKSKIEKYITENYRKLLCNGYHVRMPMRSSKVVDNYLNYRLMGNNDHRRIDHGISGGMIFYDRIIKNYINEYEHEKHHDPNLGLEEFFQDGHARRLRFNLKQLIVFMYVADCIINHNIWKASKESEKIYKQYNLHSLVGDKFEKVNFHKNPLLFILVMSDTLEPYKNFYSVCHNSGSIDNVNYNERDVIAAYEKFDISFEGNQINISVSDDLQNACETRLREMEEWIDIKFTKRNCEFLIELL